MHHQDNTITTEEPQLGEDVLGGIGNMLFKYMKKHSDKIAQIDAATGRTDTFRSLLQKCIRASIVLQKLGLKQRDIITYYSTIHINAVVPIVASFFLGVIHSFIDVSLLSSEVIHILKQVTPKLIITDPQHSQAIKDIVENAHINTKIIVYDKEFFTYQEGEASFHPIYVDDLQELSAIYFSSGSTGLPKGILLNHYHWLLNLSIIESTAEDFENENQKVIYSYDSLYWGVEMVRLINSAREGTCRLINSEKFDPKKAWYIMEKYKVNVACLIPFDLMQMCIVGKPQDVNLSSLDTIYSVGAPLHKNYELLLREILPTTDILQFYGQTEIGILTTFTKSDLHRTYSRQKVGCVGVPVKGRSYKIVDMETGKNLGPNKQGELLVKSKSIMMGYYNLDCSERFDENGWLKTGDIAFYDEDLCFFITGRIKELIIYQGWHISPVLLETELLNHPAVVKAVVIGVHHIEDGERPLGLVVVDNEINTSTEEIEEYMKMKIPERPMTVKIVKEMPLTVTGKVRRQEIKKRVLSGEI